MIVGTLALKTYLGIGTANTSDDALLGSLSQAAQRHVEDYCRRTLEPTVATRYYSYDGAQWAGPSLYLDDDLISVTQLVNGDTATLGGTAYWLYPRNGGPPYGQIKLKSSFSWIWNTDGEVSVAGTWGYAATTPPNIVQAIKRTAAYLYRSKDAQSFETTAFPEAGQLTIPRGLPVDVQQLLAPYRRNRYG